MSVKRERDAGADLVKCIGCFLVILLHVQTPVVYGKGALTGLHLFVSSLCADGVMVFFAATGFFIFREKDFLKKWRKSLRAVFLPGILALAFYLFSQRWLSGEMSLVSSIRSTGVADIKDMVFSLLHWQVPAYAGHLWYLQEYLKCLLIYPLLMYICTEEKRAVLYRRIVLAVGIAYLAIQDMGMLNLSPFKHIAPYRLISAPATMMLLGYELYSLKEKRRTAGKAEITFCLAGLFLYLIPNGIRVLLQLKLHGINPEHQYFLNWETAGSVAASAGIILMAFSCRKPQGPLLRFAGLAGPCTYGIYLIHVCFVNRMDCFGLRDRLITLLHAYDSPAGYLFTVLVLAIFVFAACLLIVLCWHWCKNLIGAKIFRKSA